MKADYLSVTMGPDDCEDIVLQLAPLLGQLGVAYVYEGVYKLHSGGSLKTGATRGPAHHVSASGDFLNALRGNNLWAEYLHIVGSVAHTVTRLDVAHDVLCNAPAELAKYRRRVEAGKVQLGRNKLDIQKHYSNVTRINPEGEKTGSSYIGPKSIQTAGLLVYDKKNEQLDRRGVVIPSTLRYELKLGRKSRVTLKDAYEPDAVFWHYMARILPAPDGIPTWEAHGTGLTLPARVTLLPAESMRRQVESSEAVKLLLTLADQCGPYGFQTLVRYLEKAKDSHTINPQTSVEASDRTGS